MNRSEVLTNAIDECLKEIYQYVQPRISWEDFITENKIYSSLYKEWENYNSAYNRREDSPKDGEKWWKLKEQYSDLEWEGKSRKECIGPSPYEFYYLNKDILKDIVDSYIYAYKLDGQQELLNTIEILKNYCKEPIVDKYIDDWTDETGFHHPGYRSYDHPNSLEKQLSDLIPDTGFDKSEIAKEVQNKFFEFLDMAGNFFNWNRELNEFNMSVYLGPSPNSNKEAVIENWKKYKDVDLTIDEELMKREYYGEDDE